MPETAQAETPARRTMRQRYQGKISERLLQAGQMALDRKMLRRGAIKQQNGTLGEPDESLDAWDDSMEIRVGDEIHYHQTKPTSAPKPAEPAAAIRDHKPRRGWLLPAALVAGSVLSGGATGWMLAYQAIKAAVQHAPPVQQAPADENTLYEFHLSKGE